MKALSIKQPWAQLISLGVKPIENRTWPTNFRGRIYIHASGKPVPFNSMENGMRFTQGQLKDVFAMKLPERFPDHMSKYPTSAIIGEVDIIDCVLGHDSVWAEHSAIVMRKIDGIHQPVEVPVYNWVLANAVIYDQPVLNVKGALSFWEWEPVGV